MAFHKPLLSLLKRRALDSHSVKPPQTITSSAEGALSSKLVYTFSPLVFIFSFYSDSISCRFQTYYNYNTNALLKKLYLHEAKNYLYRTPFEFYDYGNDPDALNNLTGDEEHAKLENRYREELLKVMQKTKDHETDRYQKALKGR